MNRLLPPRSTPLLRHWHQTRLCASQQLLGQYGQPVLYSSPQLQATRHFSFWQDFKEKLNKEIKANKELSQNLDELSKIKDEGTSRRGALPLSFLS